MSARDRPAIVLPCDANYLPYALHLIWQIRSFCPQDDFDILLFSQDIRALPDSVAALNVKIESYDTPPDLPNLGERVFPPASAARLLAPRALRDRHARILLLDSDIFFEGGDLAAFLKTDLKGRAVGAVLDGHFFRNPRHHAPEYHALGWRAMPYANCGVMLIDTDRYVTQDLDQRSLAFAGEHPEVIILQEQSALNCVLKGDMAWLSPGWNWTLDTAMRYVTQRYPVRFRHFAGQIKPWADPTCAYDARFRLSYDSFFRGWLQDAIPRVEMALQVGGQHRDDLARLFFSHFRERRKTVKILSRYEDEFASHLFPTRR